MQWISSSREFVEDWGPLCFLFVWMRQVSSLHSCKKIDIWHKFTLLLFWINPNKRYKKSKRQSTPPIPGYVPEKPITEFSKITKDTLQYKHIPLLGNYPVNFWKLVRVNHKSIQQVQGNMLVPYTKQKCHKLRDRAHTL